MRLTRKYGISAFEFAIINQDKITSQQFFCNKKVQMREQSLFQACSFSKSLTAFATLMLATQKKIDLDIPINTQLKTWKIPGNPAVSVRQCLSMTSGLAYGVPGTPISIYQKEDPLPTLQNILEGCYPAKNAAIQCNDIPGTTCKYSGAGFMVLQKLIEDVTGQAFAVFIKENIFLPLNMMRSTFDYPLTEQQNAIPGFDKAGNILSNGFENNPYSASGGLWSTASDIAKWMIALCNAYNGKDGSFISQEYAKEMLTQQLNSDFALGVVVDGEGETFNFRKTGHNNGYCCQLLMFPNIQQGIVVMTNSAAGITLINEFIATTAEKHQWPKYSENFDE